MQCNLARVGEWWAGLRVTREAVLRLRSLTGIADRSIAGSIFSNEEHISRKSPRSWPSCRSTEGCDWATHSTSWTSRIDDELSGEPQRLRAGLTGCVGCGSLSLACCKLASPADRAAWLGPGPRCWIGSNENRRWVRESNSNVRPTDLTFAEGIGRRLCGGGRDSGPVLGTVINVQDFDPVARDLVVENVGPWRNGKLAGAGHSPVTSRLGSSSNALPALKILVATLRAPYS
jgi:hypothetical protein